VAGRQPAVGRLEAALIPHGVPADAYRGRRVLVTGHTGFKGGWLALWLLGLGAHVTGFALDPEGEPTLFDSATLSGLVDDIRGDIRDRDALRKAWARARPDVVFHLAAQPIVTRSYHEPVDTISTNVLGTVHVLECAREAKQPVAVVCVTSDKCYENVEWVYGYREDDRLGGQDIYSGSKAAAEILISSYRRTFFGDGGIAVASARAGNVIGGGDWSPHRIVPDCIRALSAGRPIEIRYPHSTRPWQHVLEPLSGYLTLGAALLGGDALPRQAWNFGPARTSARSVEDVVKRIIAEWGSGSWITAPAPAARHEATLLSLSIEKAETLLGWSPRWPFDTAIARTVDWYRRFGCGESAAALCADQIAEYSRAGGHT